MSSRLRPPSGNDGKGNSSAAADRYAPRRQERMRGAGNHNVIQRNYHFSKSIGRNGRPSSLSSSSSSSTSTPSFMREGVGEGSGNLLLSSPMLQKSSQSSEIPLQSDQMAGPSSTPAMSIRSGRGAHPSSSPSKNIDPRLLIDTSHYQQVQSPTSSRNGLRAAAINGGGNGNGISINQRKQERMRGAGIHKVKTRLYHFNRRSSVSSDASNVTSENDKFGRSSSGFLDQLMAGASRRKEQDQDEGMVNHAEKGDLPDWIEQRRMERRRGAGTHAVEKRNVSFGQVSDRPSLASSSVMSESIIEEEGEEEQEYDTTGQVDPAVTLNNLSLPMQSTPMRAFQHRQSVVSDDFDFVGEDQEYPDNDADEIMDVLEVDQGTRATAAHIIDSPGSVAAQTAMIKRKSKRQASPRRTVRRKPTKKMLLGQKSAIQRRVIDLAADETIIGQADLTIQEQRDAAILIRPMEPPPVWTFPKKPLTMEELKSMKERVKEIVTLALGNEAGSGRNNVNVNDADVLYVQIRDAIQAEQQQQQLQLQGHQGRLIRETVEELLEIIFNTFTHLSKQSAERSRLISHLQQAKKRNLQIRKTLFKERSQVLQVSRTMQVLKRQELKRVQREEEEEASMNFLSQLEQVSQDWC